MATRRVSRLICELSSARSEIDASIDCRRPDNSWCRRSSTNRQETTASGTPKVSTVAAMTNRMEIRMRRRTARLYVRVETESDAPDGRDAVVGSAGRTGQLSPEPGDVHVQGLRGQQRRIVPDLVDDVLTRDDLSRPGHQRPEQLELLVGQRDLGTVHDDPTGPGLHPDAAEFQHFRLTPPKERAHPGQQFGQPERLADVIVSSRVESHDEVDLVRASGQHQHQHITPGIPDPATDLQSVRTWQPEIQDDQVDVVVQGRRQSGVAVRGDQHVVALPLERPGEGIRNR